MSTSFPLIGITGSTFIPAGELGCLRATTTRDYVFRAYADAVAFAGGVPVLIPLVQDSAIIEAYVERLDGLVLSGGVDLNPSYYHSEPHPKLGRLDPAKDSLEVELTRLALKAKLPILGVCRGIQALNVFNGGDVYQDIESEISTDVLKHVQDAPMNTLTHSVRITPETRLHDILGQDRIQVNSHHHQAIKTVAPNFQQTALASDGVIEGIELPGKHFVVGVQWHPERSFHSDEASQRVFHAFIKAAQH